MKARHLVGLLALGAAAWGAASTARYLRDLVAGGEPPGVQDLNAAAPIDTQVALGLWQEHRATH